MTIGLLPLPSLLRATAQDTASARMRTAGRTKWNRADYNASVETLNRWVERCYGEGEEGWTRFVIASELERAGRLSIRMTVKQLNAEIDHTLNVKG